MAQCDFLGVQNVKGTLSKNVKYVNGKKVTVRVLASVRGGKQRVYLRTEHQRSTKIKPHEIEIRNKFARVQAAISALSEERKMEYHRQWKKDGYKYNGKTYKTLRGYIMARLYNEV